MIMPRNIPDIAIIGAGVSGLACAERLAEGGLQVQVLDKGRQAGGRVARRSRGGVSFEHGAPGRRDLIDRLTARVAVVNGCRITGIERTRDDRWRLRAADGPLRSHYAEVVLAMPPLQAVALLQPGAPDLAGRLGSASMTPVLTAMVALPAPLGRGLDSMTFSDASLAEARRQPTDHASGVEGWVLHASPAFSRDNLECDPDAVAQHLWERFRVNLGLVTSTPVLLRGHRWRYGRTAEPLGVDCIHDPSRGLGICGDWCLGDGVDEALASGRALAAHMLGIPERPAHRVMAAREGLA
jgi:hypothetical protein